MRGLRRHKLTAVVTIGGGALALVGLLGGLVLSGVWPKVSTSRGRVPLLSEVAAVPGDHPSTMPPIGLSPMPPAPVASIDAVPAQVSEEHPSRPSPPIQWADPVPAVPFTLIDQDGQQVSLRDCLGKVVLLNFIFTHCNTACPLMTDELKVLAEQLRPHMGRDVVFLSVTIDPERDTPAVLKQFGQKYTSDFRTWRFLTGDATTIAAVLEAYRVAVERPAEAAAHDDQLMHSTPLYLIDQWGRVRKRFAPTYLKLRGTEPIEVLLREGQQH
ncbi:MAG TPA: SCO family protein [Alphaproteobacteria bacterium]|nr:SCO family protein [Alphaproteobacteria bacterium]